jgi:sec-independent protein translocase protein TatA
MELLLILIIVLIIFGAGKLPQLGEGIGRAIKGFKKSVSEPEPTESGSEGAATAPMEIPPPEPERSGPPGPQAGLPPRVSEGTTHDSSQRAS